MREFDSFSCRHLKGPLEYSVEGADIFLIGREEVRLRIGVPGKVFGNNLSNNLSMMKRLVAAVRAHNPLAISACRR